MGVRNSPNERRPQGLSMCSANRSFAAISLNRSRAHCRRAINRRGYVSCAHLPHAAESHGDRLAVHAPGSVAAEERDHLRDLARLEHPLLRVEGGALVPNLLNAD